MTTRPTKRQKVESEKEIENVNSQQRTSNIEMNSKNTDASKEHCDKIDEIGSNEQLIEETERLFGKENLLRAFEQIDYLLQNKNAILSQWNSVREQTTETQSETSSKYHPQNQDSSGVNESQKEFDIDQVSNDPYMDQIEKCYNEILEFLKNFDYLLYSQHPETLETVCHWIIRCGNDDQHSYNNILKTLIGELGAPWNFVDKNEKSLGDLLLELGNQELYDWLVNYGVQVELILRAVGKKSQLPCTISAKDEEIDHDDYLKQKLIFKEGVILDADGNGVMMGWERPLMEIHAQVLCSPWSDTLKLVSESTHSDTMNTDDQGSEHESLPSLEDMRSTLGLDTPQTYAVLNVGFGLGIIDELLQSYQPTRHVIIEAHPDVYAKMIEDGWHKKPGVEIKFGKWQAVVEELQDFDAIFFDTFGEDYAALAEFNEHLPKMLKPQGIYSFFNGLAARNILFHDVACQIVESDLASLGIETQFVEVEMEVNDEEWALTRDKYWKLKDYRLPICTFEG